MLPLLLTAVSAGRLSLDRLVELAHEAPRRIFGLPAQPDTWVEVDPAETYTLGDEPLHTRCGWTPFAGMPVRGRVRRVLLRGQPAFDRGRVLSPPGGGRVVEPES
jgi:carbamoyl-phosphate synthase/aspartate carbamoyltransferase/dihydroorotase